MYQRNQSVILLAVLILIGSVHAQPAQPQTFESPAAQFTFGAAPRLFLDPDTQSRALRNLASSNPLMQAAWSHVQTKADRALAYNPVATVYTGSNLADFATNGGGYFDMAQDSGLRYRLKGSTQDGRRAADFLLAWSRAKAGSQVVLAPPSTTLKYGDAPNVGLYYAHVAVPAANSYALAFPAMTQSERVEVETWLRTLTDRVEEGRANWIAQNSIDNTTYYNYQYMSNHLSYHNAAFAAVGMALRDTVLTQKAFNDPVAHRDYFNMVGGAVLMEGKGQEQFMYTDKSKVTLDGMIFDRYRTASGAGLGYSMLHLNLLQATAEMAYINGTDILGFNGPRGESLKTALGHYSEYLLDGSIDPYGTGYFSHPSETVPYLFAPLYQWGWTDTARQGSGTRRTARRHSRTGQSSGSVRICSC